MYTKWPVTLTAVPADESPTVWVASSECHRLDSIGQSRSPLRSSSAQSLCFSNLRTRIPEGKIAPSKTYDVWKTFGVKQTAFWSTFRIRGLWIWWHKAKRLTGSVFDCVTTCSWPCCTWPTYLRRHLGLALIQDCLGAYYHKHGPEGYGRSGFISARNTNNSLHFFFMNSLIWLICQIWI